MTTDDGGQAVTAGVAERAAQYDGRVEPWDDGKDGDKSREAEEHVRKRHGRSPLPPLWRPSAVPVSSAASIRMSSSEKVHRLRRLLKRRPSM